MADELIVEDADGVAVLTLNRPNLLNALNVSLHRALNEALTVVAHRRDIRCVILTGAGRGFCAGGDMKAVAQRDGPVAKPSTPPGEQLERRIDMIREHAIASRLLHDMGKPTIAMINGPCAGAGLSLAGACDLRFAAHSATFTSAFVKVGVSSGGTWFWSQILGAAKARRLYLMSEVFDAAAARDYGLVHEVWPDEELTERTFAVARQLAAMPPAALRFSKEALNAAEDGTLEQVFELEALAQTIAGASKRK